MLKTLLQMTRPVNIVIAIITLVVGYFLLGVIPETCTLVLQSLGFAFAIGFGNIQNDILDFESDKKNRPERPLPSGRISMKAAKIAWITMFTLSIACGVIDTILCYISLNKVKGIELFIPTIFFTILALLLVAYNKKLKHTPLLKNMTVAFLCATPLILNLLYTVFLVDVHSGGLLSRLGNLYPAMLFAFLLTTAREIYKDLEDETGDLMAGIMTFPLIAGSSVARRFAGLLVIFCWALLPLPVMQDFYSYWFLIIAAITLTPTLAAAIVFAHKKNYHRAQSIIKIAMFLGLIALVISTIVDPHYTVVTQKIHLTYTKPGLMY